MTDWLSCGLARSWVASCTGTHRRTLRNVLLAAPHLPQARSRSLCARADVQVRANSGSDKGRQRPWQAVRQQLDLIGHARQRGCPGGVREADGDRNTGVALDVDLAGDLLHERTDQAVAERAFAEVGHADAVITHGDLHLPRPA